MAKPNFHDRSWDEIDWEAWGPHFSIRDRATSIGELQNGIATRYIEVQNLLSRLPPHAGKAHNLVVMWRHEVNGLGRTIHFAESSRILKRLDELHVQVTMQAEAARQAAKVAKKHRHRALAAAAVARPAEGSSREEDGFVEGYDGPTHSAATARQRSDQRPGQDTAAARWLGVQAVMARECDHRLSDTARPVTNKHFLAAIHAPEGVTVEQFQHARGQSPIRVVVAGGLQFWSTGLPTLEQFGIARYAVYRRDGMSLRFDHAAGNRRPEDLSAEREAVEGGAPRTPGAPDPVA